MAARGGKRYGLLLIVLALALLSWWFQRQASSPAPAVEGGAHRVDYSMSDFEVTVMDEAGRPRHQLDALAMRHYGDDDSAELEQPSLLLHRTLADGTAERWRLQSERAQLHQGGERVLLEGRVVMQRLDPAGRVTLELETRDLRVEPRLQRAESDAAVEIREGRGTTRAKGLKIDLKAGQIELLAAVRGDYVGKR